MSTIIQICYKKEREKSVSKYFKFKVVVSSVQLTHFKDVNTILTFNKELPSASQLRLIFCIKCLNENKVDK